MPDKFNLVKQHNKSLVTWLVRMKNKEAQSGGRERISWLPLDNAAKIYPAVMNEELSSVFRITCTLSSPVRIGALREALQKTTGRFPYFNTTLRRGFFWYFLEFSDEIRPTLVGEEEKMLTAFPSKSAFHALYRVLARGNRISVEFLHILTDGGGALQFLRTLLVSYFNLCGTKVPYSEGIIDPASSVNPEETEDAFKKYYTSTLPYPDKLKNSWHLPWPVKKPVEVMVIEAETSITQMKRQAKDYNVSLTEYLAAVYLYALQSIFYDTAGSDKKRREPIIRLEVPVNMRRLLPSNTMRNFALFVMPEIDTRLGEFTFEEIVRVVYHYMRSETDIKLIKRIITRNVKPEYNPVIRIMPLFIKNLVLTMAFHKHGSTKYASVLTNLGSIDMPEEARDLITSFSITPPPPTRKLKVSCGMVSYGDVARLIFTNLTGNPELEKRVFRFLSSSGIDVKIIKRK